MRIRKLAKDRQEFLVFGELLLFVLAWTLGIAAAVDDYRSRTNAGAQGSVATNSNFSDRDSSGGPGSRGHSFLVQPSEFD